MFSILKKLYPTKKVTNHKKNTSLIFNDNSNPFLFEFLGGDNFPETAKDKSFETKNNRTNYFQDCNEKEFLNTFAKTIISTILKSRKDNKNNLINISNNSSNDKLFGFDINDLFMYNDISQLKNGIQKYVIEFYLIKNEGNKTINELVEKWKISYNLNQQKEVNNNKYDFNFLKNKILILKKSIITYSRLLPLYQYIQNNEEAKNYSIDFKFYSKTSNKKGVFRIKPSGNITLKNSDLFSFKMNLKFFSQKEIKKIFNEEEEYIDLDIDIKKDNKIKSLSFHKSTSKLNGFEIIENLKDDNNPININKINILPNEINKNKIKEKDTLFESSSSSSFTLNIYDFNDKNQMKNDLNLLLDKKAKDKKEENFLKDVNNDIFSKKKYSLFSNSYETTEDCTPRNSEIKSNEKKETKISPYLLANKKNSKINNIIKEYNLLKDLMQNLPNFNNIKTKKFITYTDAFE